jgi:hypothetical protein
MMGLMFEQQFRIAHTLGAAALAANPLIAGAPMRPRSGTIGTGTSGNGATAKTPRQTRAPSAPPRMPETVKRTHSMPV